MPRKPLPDRPMAEMRTYRITVTDATRSEAHEFEAVTVHARSVASALMRASMLPAHEWTEAE